jgi:hypothetical protein
MKLLIEIPDYVTCIDQADLAVTFGALMDEDNPGMPFAIYNADSLSSDSLPLITSASDFEDAEDDEDEGDDEGAEEEAEAA